MNHVRYAVLGQIVQFAGIRYGITALNDNAGLLLNREFGFRHFLGFIQCAAFGLHLGIHIPVPACATVFTACFLLLDVAKLPEFNSGDQLKPQQATQLVRIHIPAIGGN